MTYDIILFTDLAGYYGHIKSLGAYRLASELREHGYTVKVVDFVCKLITNEKLFKTLLDSLIGTNTLFVGWSSNFFGIYSQNDRENHSNGSSIDGVASRYPTEEKKFSMWLKYIKKKFSTKIVYGGACAYENADLVDDIDYVVVGLADATIIDLANHLKNQTSLKFRPSMTHKWKILDYDKLGGSFNFSSSVTTLTDADHITNGEVLTLETSRGCMFKCKFCGYPLLGRKKTDPAYHRNQDCLSNELLYNWDKFKTNKYIIVDDTFNETVSKLELMLRARDEAKIDLELTAYLRIDILNKFPEQIKLLKDMGLKAAFFGVESFNDKTASSVGKGAGSERVKAMLYQIKDEFGSEFCSQVGLIAGLPYETPDTFNEGMEWVLEHNSPIDSVRISPLSIRDRTFPSEFDKDYEKYGYTLTNNGGWVNDVWDSRKAVDIAEYFHKIAYDSRKQKLGNFELFGLMNYGHKRSEIKDIPIKDLNWGMFKNNLSDYYINYVNTLLEYENIDYKGII